MAPDWIFLDSALWIQIRVWTYNCRVSISGFGMRIQDSGLRLSNSRFRMPHSKFEGVVVHWFGSKALVQTQYFFIIYEHGPRSIARIVVSRFLIQILDLLFSLLNFWFLVSSGALVRLPGSSPLRFAVSGFRFWCEFVGSLRNLWFLVDGLTD